MPAMVHADPDHFDASTSQSASDSTVQTQNDEGLFQRYHHFKQTPEARHQEV